jgi:hypothetical protein
MAGEGGEIDLTFRFDVNATLGGNLLFNATSVLELYEKQKVGGVQ